MKHMTYHLVLLTTYYGPTIYCIYTVPKTCDFSCCRALTHMAKL